MIQPGRGAMAPVEIKGKHDCTKSDCGTAIRERQLSADRPNVIVSSAWFR